jgi:hypothetical protein
MHAAILVALRLNSDRSERQRGGDRVEGGLTDGDPNHVGDMGPARASRQNSPRARGGSNAGADAQFAGQDQIYAVATRRPARLF